MTKIYIKGRDNNSYDKYLKKKKWGVVRIFMTKIYTLYKGADNNVYDKDL